MTTSGASCCTRSVIWLMEIFTLMARDELAASGGKIWVSFSTTGFSLVETVDDKESSVLSGCEGVYLSNNVLPL